MRALILVFVVTLLVFSSGCTVPRPGEGRPKWWATLAKEPPTTSTSTTGPTTTLHRHLPIRPVNFYLTTTSTTSSSTTTSTTTTSTSTSTTVTIVLERRVYTTHGDMSFYLTDIEYTEQGNVYTMDYNTSDDKWDTRTFSNTTLIDDLEVGVAGFGPKIVLTLYVKQNEALAGLVPKNSTVFMLGGGLSNRTLLGYTFSLDSALGDRVKLRVTNGTELVTLELRDGDVMYYGNLEIGILDSRMRGGYVMLYALDDIGIYDEHAGLRYCARGDMVFNNAKSMLVTGGGETEHGELNLTVKSATGPTVRVGVKRGSFQADFSISCGSSLDLYGERFNMMWYGANNGNTAKLVAHE